MKLPLRDLNLNPYPPHPTSTYTCRVIIALRVCGDKWIGFKIYILGNALIRYLMRTRTKKPSSGL